VDGTAGKGAHQQPGGSGDQMGADPIPGAAARWRGGQPPADGSAAEDSDGAMMAETVQVTGVTKSYGKANAVTDLSCTLREGETIALVGHNGAGKTTLIKLMLGLIRPNSGTVRVLGDDPAAGQFAARQRLGYLPE